MEPTTTDRHHPVVNRAPSIGLRAAFAVLALITSLGLILPAISVFIPPGWPDGIDSAYHDPAYFKLLSVMLDILIPLPLLAQILVWFAPKLAWRLYVGSVAAALILIFTVVGTRPLIVSLGYVPIGAFVIVALMGRRFNR